MWIGAENVQTNKILLDIQKYLNGLDNIVIGDGSEDPKGEKFREVYCEEPVYGHFIVIINKMMGGSSDIELQKELMEPEPGSLFNEFMHTDWVINHQFYTFRLH